MKRPRTVLAVLLAATAAGIVAGSALARARAPRRAPVITVSEPVTIEVSESLAEAGAIDVHAIANFPVHSADRNFMWALFVRTKDDQGKNHVVWQREYDAQHFTQKAGESGQLTFDERVELQPGVYNVLVGLLRQIPFVDASGTVTERKLMTSTSRLFTVL